MPPASPGLRRNTIPCRARSRRPGHWPFRRLEGALDPDAVGGIGIAEEMDVRGLPVPTRWIVAADRTCRLGVHDGNRHGEIADDRSGRRSARRSTGRRTRRWRCSSTRRRRGRRRAEIVVPEDRTARARGRCLRACRTRSTGSCSRTRSGPGRSSRRDRSGSGPKLCVVRTNVPVGCIEAVREAGGWRRQRQRRQLAGERDVELREVRLERAVEVPECVEPSGST